MPEAAAISGIALGPEIKVPHCRWVSWRGIAPYVGFLRGSVSEKRSTSQNLPLIKAFCLAAACRFAALLESVCSETSIQRSSVNHCEANSRECLKDHCFNTKTSKLVATSSAFQSSGRFFPARSHSRQQVEVLTRVVRLMSTLRHSQ